uniref:Lymphoid-restricted membrane protein n=1 Tax=Gadus morhua TaxID=8049 RepID=A0A8C5A555_GADMO
MAIGFCFDKLPARNHLLSCSSCLLSPELLGFPYRAFLSSRDVEFQRLSLGFKCDLFTLEKRLRLEERSRDLAEENVRKEISSCQGLLQALIPLCDDDSQSIEIVHRLQKNLEILIQSMTRVSSRSEMLGAIHQEHRVGRAVEVMFQHVENLKRMYTKEHTELVELRQTLMQNERSFGSQTDKGTPGTPSDQHQTHRRTLTLGAFSRRFLSRAAYNKYIVRRKRNDNTSLIRLG